jgi:hypothetical protein
MAVRPSLSRDRIQGKKTMRNLVLRLSAVVAAFAPIACADFAQATVFRVDTTRDLVDADTGDRQCRAASNTCSLRAAIMQANRLPASDQAVIFLPTGSYRLTITTLATGNERYGDLNTSPLTNMILIGDGAGATIIDGNHTDGVLTVGDAAFIPMGAVHATFVAATAVEPVRLFVVLGPSYGPAGYEAIDVSHEEPWATLRT